MKIKIIYETQTGTTQYVAETIQQHLISLGHQADLHSLRNQGLTPNLEGYDAVLFGSPTYEDGQLERTVKIFITKTTLDLSKYRVGVFGLGNSTYPQFCTSAGFLEEWVKQNKGQLAVASLKVDGFPDDPAPIQQWAETFAPKG